MLKKSLFLCSLLFLLLFSVCAAQEQAKPLKVAIMPIATDVSGYKNVKADLYNSLKQQMSIPLNDTLHVVEYLDTETVYLAMQKSGFTDKQNLDTLKSIADLLDADVVVGYSVPNMYQHYFHMASHLDGAPVISTYISLKLWAYFRPLDETVKLSTQRNYVGTLNTASVLPALADDASYFINKKADLKGLLKQSIQIQKGDVQ